MSSCYFQTIASAFWIFNSVIYCNICFFNICIIHQFDEHIFCVYIQVLEKIGQGQSPPVEPRDLPWEASQFINKHSGFICSTSFKSSLPYYQPVHISPISQGLLRFHSTSRRKPNSLSPFLSPSFSWIIYPLMAPPVSLLCQQSGSNPTISLLSLPEEWIWVSPDTSQRGLPSPQVCTTASKLFYGSLGIPPPVYPLNLHSVIFQNTSHIILHPLMKTHRNSPV